jgi:hypothetical protein
MVWTENISKSQYEDKKTLSSLSDSYLLIVIHQGPHRTSSQQGQGRQNKRLTWKRQEQFDAKNVFVKVRIDHR